MLAVEREALRKGACGAKERGEWVRYPLHTRWYNCTIQSTERLFTNAQLLELVTPTGDRALAAIDAGDLDTARRLAGRMVDEALPLHDGLVDWIAGLLSFIGRRSDDADMERALRQSTAVWIRPFNDSVDRSSEASLKKSIRGITRVLRSHLRPLTVLEDEEKVTFVQDPCGSCGRLLRQRQYEGDNAFHLVKGPSPITFQREHLAAYNTHCPVAHEILPTEWSGAPLFVTFCPEDPDDPCLLHFYKDVSRIPDAIYTRMGKERPAPAAGGASFLGRLFTDAELAELSEPTAKRAVAALDLGDLDKARQLIRWASTEGRPLHDALVDWIAQILTFIYREYGDAALEEALDWSGSRMTRPLIDSLATKSVPQRVRIIARIFRSHLRPFSIDEDDEKFIFRQDPCGSGGRLLREGAYERPDGPARVKKAQRITYGREDFPIYCTHCSYVHELLPIRWTGAPLYVTFPVRDPSKTCDFYVYKDPAAVPDLFLQRWESPASS